MEEAEFQKKVIELNNKDVMAIVKSDDLTNKILNLFWLEKILNIKRLGIYDIKVDKLEDIKTIFNKNTDKFYWFFKTENSKSKTYKSVKYKIEHITGLNLLQKFVADCYNTVCDDAVKIIKKEIYVKKVFSHIEYSFKYHIKIPIKFLFFLKYYYIFL